ncbi:cell division cycle-associated protein 2 [Bufo bufo]|uniref:cell division cycle-associated protein 2 n=1 Tax=Bufo bufo TaxID=8384 RepID=UPI001ABDAB72|nr:cell division cycle-associated protein 2 [Bufo bufo]
MARRNVLQEIPISVPQTEQQSYQMVTEEEEDSLPYNKPIPSAQRPHSRYISNDESKENITPSQLENIFQEKSQVKTLDGSSVGDEPGALSNVNVFTPKRSEGSPEDLQPCSTPMDFSTVTVENLDITSESFTTKCASDGKSPKSFYKHRRRSTIGVRGSPEMNFLIRQIALQRSNRKSEPEPEGNPFSSPRNSVLREKIAAFRNAFQAVEETEGKLAFPGFSEVEELKSGRGERTSEPPEKRKKICGPSDVDLPNELHKTSAASCPAQPSEKSVPEKTLESDCTLASRPLTEVPSKSVEVLTDEAQMLPDTSRSRKRKVMFAGASPPEPEQSLKTEDSSGLVLKPALKKTPRRDFLHFQLGFPEEDGDLFSLDEEADDEINNKPVDSVKMKKRVTFGRELSPEIFDKTLPANTPIRRGSTPYNYHKFDATPSAEQSFCQSPSACAPVPQPDFDEEETLQPVSLCFDAASDSDSPVSPALPEHRAECDPHEVSAAADIINESFIASPEVSPAATTRQTRSRQKLTSSKTNPERNGLKSKGRSNAKKPKKSAIGKKVQTYVSRGRGKKKGMKSKKSVQKPVHSEREVVSRKPLLSPIPELPECIPTPPASTSQSFLHVGKSFHEHPMKKVHTEVLENHFPFTLEDSLERSFEEKAPERPSLCAVEDVQTPDASTAPALVDVKVSNGSPEKSEEVLDLIPQADLVSSECPQSSTVIDVIAQITKSTTSGLASSSVEKISKSRSTKRRSSSCRSVSHASVNSENTVDCVKQEDTHPTSHTPETCIDYPVQGAVEVSSVPNELAEESSTTSHSTPPISSVTTERKKSRRSSRVHVSNILSANPEQREQTIPGEHTASMLPYPVDPSLNDFCLPIDEALQFPQPEKKVRRSMRLRRDSGVIGLSWVQENDVNETTGRRKSLSSVTRLEESSALSLENTAHSPNKENLSSYHVANPPRRARRRSLCTTTIQESLSTCDKKRRSNCFYKAPNAMPTSDEADRSALVPDA